MTSAVELQPRLQSGLAAIGASNPPHRLSQDLTFGKAARAPMRSFWISPRRFGVFCLLLAAALPLPQRALSAMDPAVLNDYPTDARAEYVFACMASNGQSQRVLEQCSCSIDVIASILTYDDYVAAETVARLGLMGGEKGAMFRTGQNTKEMVATLKRAQAEGEIRCF